MAAEGRIAGARPMAASPLSVFVARLPLVAALVAAPAAMSSAATAKPVVSAAAASAAAAAFVVAAARARIASAAAAVASGSGTAWPAVAAASVAAAAASVAAAAVAYSPLMRSAGATRCWRWRPAALFFLPPELVARADGVSQAGQLVGRPDVVPQQEGRLGGQRPHQAVIRDDLVAIGW